MASGKPRQAKSFFIHAGAVQGVEVLTIGTDAWVQVVSDDARAQGGGYRAKRVWGGGSEKAWKAERDKEQREQSGPTSKASSGTDCRTCSSV